MTIETAVVVKKSPNEEFKESCIAMCEGFEKVFRLTKVGSVQCDKKAREEVMIWFSTFKMLIALFSGVDIPDLEFETANDEQTLVRNKIKMTQYYAFAYTSYVKFCQTLKRNAVNKIESVEEPSLD